ncbi:MAG: hypothetical protein SPI77_07170 [Corynebacterium sp.]|nr:hypothetical protein [Corynebacterium sp.]
MSRRRSAATPLLTLLVIVVLIVAAGAADLVSTKLHRSWDSLTTIDQQMLAELIGACHNLPRPRILPLLRAGELEA